MVQAVRYGPIGSGLLVITSPSPISIPIRIIALIECGPSTMAALIVVSGLFQIAISMRLSLLRRIVTQVVSGTIIILMVVTILNQYQGGMCIPGVLKTTERTQQDLASLLGLKWAATDSGG